LFKPIEADKLNLTGTQYQLDKFIKHTMPTNLSGLVSVFDQSPYEKYKGYTVSGSLSGSVEKDDKGRTNIVWYAGKNIGVTFDNGRFLADADTVKVVLIDNEVRVHSFPVDSFKLEKKKCANCGADILS
jgi:hypothetical protein